MDNRRKERIQQIVLYSLMIICIAVIILGGTNYVASLRKDLMDQTVQNVMTVTSQQQQAFDNFITEDQERLHSFSEAFSAMSSEDVEEIQKRLGLFHNVDAFYSVINLETGEFYSNVSADTYQLGPDELEVYRNLQGSGARDPYQGLLAEDTMFGYYECFSFADGGRGLVQKSYDSNKVSNEFSLTFYNDQGFSYVVNRDGDILMRPENAGAMQFDNVFEALKSNYDESVVNELVSRIAARENGHLTVDGDTGRFVYTYASMESVEDWYLVSIVPEEVIWAEADRILTNSRAVFGVLLAVLTIVGIVGFLLWRGRRQSEEKDRAIEYQEQLFDIFSTYLSSNTNDVYLMLDLNNTEKPEYISPNAQRVLGVDYKTAVEQIRRLIEPDTQEETVSVEALRALAPGESIEGVRTRWVNPHTGENQSFLVNAYCTLVQGKPRLVMYISDRTQERRSQDNLSEALHLAQMASSAKSSFLSSVSHDIRTPMNAIIGFAGLLKNEADDPDMVREYTGRIEAASNHLLELINDVLDMNKIESGGAMLNLSELALPEIIDEVNTIIRPQTNAKGQTFEIFATSLEHEHLIGDKLRINQILINLLSNAVKYTPEGGNIQMHVEELPQVMEDYSRVRFTVKDNGLGMSEEYQKVIFEPFTREETTVTHQIQGTGFGMAITKSLVDLMGGTIHVHSQLDVGGVFTVELEMNTQEQEIDPHFWQKHHVSRMIVADDDENVCRNVAKAMEPTGVVVDYATGGHEAVETIRQARVDGRPYDLILLDWKMPGLDGLETARLIREKYPERIPILLFTAYDWGEIEQEAKEIGIHHFMPKPFFMSTFKEAIRRIMGSIKTADEESSARIAQGRKLLVVDDIEVNRIILVKILSTMGASCEVAGNGQEALDKFLAAGEPGYDAILMDVQMPVMDGYQATRAIRASLSPRAKTIPIIAMTANAFVDDVRDAINSGMNAHVAKPIQMDKLRAALVQVFEQDDAR